MVGGENGYHGVLVPKRVESELPRGNGCAIIQSPPTREVTVQVQASKYEYATIIPVPAVRIGIRTFKYIIITSLIRVLLFLIQMVATDFGVLGQPVV